MKCYYEILDVARDADDTEIKTSYRKLALKWHPDKNLDNEELAKEQFQLVQQAYEVLSDRHERAWYDNHREQILRGSDANFEDDSLDVFQYFTTQCFKGYGDDEKGFYTVYRNVFEQIAKEDIEYMDSKSDYDEIPRFGTSTSDYEDVVGPFYAYWMGYTTRKSYVWLDPYNINETRERRVLKLIEKENKKVRLKAKKERNEEIRNLVAFVRKRDKRVLAYSKQLEIKNAENRQKQEEIRKQKLLERKKEMHTKTQAEWTNFNNVQRELQEIEKNLAAQFGEDLSESDEENSVEESDYYCVACNKVFKTPKAFANHESSKKHRENVEKIKIEMREEEDEYQNEDDTENEEDLDISSESDDVKNENISPSEENIVATSDVDVISDVEEINNIPKKRNKKNKKVIRIQNHSISEDVEHKNENISPSEENIVATSDVDGISDVEENNIPKKRNKKNKKVIRIQNHSISEEAEHSDKETKTKIAVTTKSEDDFDFGSSKKQKKKNRNKQAQTQIDNTTKTIEETKVTENGASETNDNYIPTKRQTNTKTKSNKNKTQQIDLEDIDTSHVCVTCKSNFSSKNKLFDHLKKTGHSVLINQQKPPKSKKKVK